jgi:hypothetical protein
MIDAGIDDVGLRIKESPPWFAAGAAFERALRMLSDGAFKLFAHICLQADRRTGRLATTHRDLARTLGKSRRVIGGYVAELDRNRICLVRQGTNQFARTILEIHDDYWPYEKHPATTAPAPEESPFVEAVRAAFLSIACGAGRFTASDLRTARQMQADGIPLAVVEDAILLGACRKYVSWLNGGEANPIGSLRYFQSIVAELRDRELPDDYREHMRLQSARYAARWKLTKAGQNPPAGGHPDMASPEIAR